MIGTSIYRPVDLFVRKRVKMAPMQRLPASETAAKVEGLSPITAFFSPQAVRGRKKKIKGQSNAGHPRIQKRHS